jgi:hypothetical protein
LPAGERAVSKGDRVAMLVNCVVYQEGLSMIAIDVYLFYRFRKTGWL